MGNHVEMTPDVLSGPKIILKNVMWWLRTGQMELACDKKAAHNAEKVEGHQTEAHI